MGNESHPRPGNKESLLHIGVPPAAPASTQKRQDTPRHSNGNTVSSCSENQMAMFNEKCRPPEITERKKLTQAQHSVGNIQGQQRGETLEGHLKKDYELGITKGTVY